MLWGRQGAVVIMNPYSGEIMLWPALLVLTRRSFLIRKAVLYLALQGSGFALD